jgi:BirA family biotin operon repressor/biotin-[acetyl-CoA-carboxylase] ligase
VIFSRLAGELAAPGSGCLGDFLLSQRVRFRDASIARFPPVISRMGTARFSLLRILADGEVHSSERVCRTLGMSEIEVGRLVMDLEALGPRILSARLGYRLEEPVDLIDANLLAERMERENPGLEIEILDECPSTNTALAARARAGAPQGTVLVCEHQSVGRGRRGNIWVSAVGGSVIFSVLWRFPEGAGALTGLSLAVAVGAAKALEKLGVPGVAVKWPNDLLYRDGKVGGILIETAGDGAGPIGAVVGVGINMRLGRSARERIARPVADIAASGIAMPSRTAVLAGLLSSVTSSLELFSREGFAPFRQAWLDRHAWQGRRVILSQGSDRVAEGEAVGIADDGALELSSKQGIRRFHSGELSLRLE